MSNKDYIDTVVLTEEPQALDAVPKRPAGTINENPFVNDVRLTRVRGVEVNSLTIEESSEDGGDPYNSTGKHCVLKRIKE